MAKGKPLTAKSVAALKEPGRYRDYGTPNLYLNVTASITKNYQLRYQLNGEKHEHGLGSAADFSLKEARERARAARQLIADGIDPIDKKHEAKRAARLEAAKAITFEQAAKSYFAQHQAKWKNAKHSAQFLSSLKAYAFPKIGRLAVADVDVGQVLRCIEPIWHDKTETANRVRQRIEGVLDWAAVRGYRSGENPGRWKGNLDQVLPLPDKIKTPKHHSAMSYAAVPEFMAELADRQAQAARALAFTILTAARTGETIGATWDEINFNERTWIIPAGRMKAGRAHTVPLAAPVIKLLEDLPREAGNDFVFIGGQTGGGLSNMSLLALLRRMGQSITTHGMRSAFRIWCAERTSYPAHVAELSLAHSVGSQVEQAYLRTDLLEKRRRLMSEWARYCYSQPVTTATVIGIRAAR